MADERKLKTFELHWMAEITGIQLVQAFDREDAEKKFSTVKFTAERELDAVLEHVYECDPTKKR